MTLDEETGAWYQHKGRDFKEPLVDYHQGDGNIVGSKRGSALWSGPFGQLSNMVINSEASDSNDQDRSSNSAESKEEKWKLEGSYEELPIAKEVTVENSVSVSVRKSLETSKNFMTVFNVGRTTADQRNQGFWRCLCGGLF